MALPYLSIVGLFSWGIAIIIGIFLVYNWSKFYKTVRDAVEGTHLESKYMVIPYQNFFVILIVIVGAAILIAQVVAAAALAIATPFIQKILMNNIQAELNPPTKGPQEPQKTFKKLEFDE
jgi:uncharacterized membrane protein